jgi:hypothetical protein
MYYDNNFKMEIQKVTLNKTDTCLTYSLKRIGLDPHLCTYENFNEFFHQIPWKAKRKELVKGCILLWDKDVTWKWMPVSISKDCIIKSKSIPTGFHFAVYEGDNIISDCNRLQSIAPPSPSLRIRELSDVKKNPDWILIYEEKENK